MAIDLHFLFQAIELLNGSRDYTWLVLRTLHSVGFTAARLTVSEYAYVVTVKGTLDQHFGIFKDLFLGGKSAEARVKAELLLNGLMSIRYALLALMLHFKLQCKLISHSDYLCSCPSLLNRVHRPNSAEHPNFSLQVFKHIMQALPLEYLIGQLSVHLLLLTLQLLHSISQEHLALLRHIIELSELRVD